MPGYSEDYKVATSKCWQTLSPINKVIKLFCHQYQGNSDVCDFKLDTFFDVLVYYQYTSVHALCKSEMLVTKRA